MSNKSVGLVLVLVGLLLLCIGVGADALGLGGHPGFGWKQILAAVVGALVAGFGIWQLSR